MLSFTRSDGHFHVRAAVWCVRHDAVLVHQAVGDVVWSLPGGRVEMGETSAVTLQREMAEELETRVVDMTLRAVIEVIDRRAQGGFFHEVGFYYAAELPDVLWQETPFRGCETSNPVDFWWCPLAMLGDVVLLPPVLHHVRDTQTVQHLVYQA